MMKFHYFDVGESSFTLTEMVDGDSSSFELTQVEGESSFDEDDLEEAFTEILSSAENDTGETTVNIGGNAYIVSYELNK